jgi:ABC-type taurine transport system ATPase subunit
MIEVSGLTKRFGPVTAVDGLSFTVRPGRVTGFLGPNGAGKTTTLRIILGLDAPAAGRALVGGRPYQRIIRPLHEAGAMLDANAVHPGRSAWHHLRAIARSNGIGAARVTEVLALTGLDAVAGRRAGGFSLGMKQRLGIAAALLGVPGAVLAGGFYLAVVALLGVGLGVILRSTAAAIAVAVALTYLIPEILSLLPPPWNGRIDRFLPLTAAQQLVSLHPRTDMFAPALSLLVVAGWAVAVLAAACAVIARRDA